MTDMRLHIQISHQCRHQSHHAKASHASLMNGTETAQGDVGMFSMLKDICSKVSSERTTVNDKATDRLVHVVS
jgi:hypothetical protein